MSAGEPKRVPRARPWRDDVRAFGRRVARAVVVFARRHPLYLAAFGICSFFVLRPLWGVVYLPLLDWPQHVGLVSVVANAFDEASGTYRFYEPYASVTSYLTLYWGGAALSWITGTTVALKLITSAYFLALPASLAMLLRAFGRSPWPSLLAFTAAWCWPFYMGFVAFVIALPLGFASLALLVRAAHSPRRRTLIALAITSTLLFFTHAMAYGWFVAVGGVWAIGLVVRRRRALGRVVLATTPSLAVFAWWFIGQFVSDHIDRLGAGTLQIQSPSAAGGADVQYRPIAEKIDTIFFFFNEGFRGDEDLEVAHVYGWCVAALALCGVVLLVVRRLRKDARKRSAPRWLPISGVVITTLFVGLYFAMPMMANTIWAISPRVIVIFALGALLLVPPLFRRERWNAMVGVPLVALAIYTANLNYDRFVEFQRETEGFAEVMSHAEPGRRLYGVIHDAGSTIMSQAVFLHYPAYYMDDPGGLVGFTFIVNPTIPVQLRTLGSAPYPGRRSEWEPHRFRWDIYGPFYDYVLVRGNVSMLPMQIGAQSGDLSLVHAAGRWGLYENAHAADAVVHSFYENLHRAEVFEVGEAGGADEASTSARACAPWDGHGFQCPQAEWTRVEPSELSFMRRTLPCVFAHPLAGKTLRISFDEVPAEGNVIRGFAGVADSGQHAGGADVTLTAFVDGVAVGAIAAGSQPGYRTFAFPVPPADHPRTVRFDVSTPNDGARHFGFLATLLEERAR